MHYQLKVLPPTLDIDELAELLKLSPRTINNDLSRNPSRIPPPSPKHARRGRRVWITAHVLAWLAEPAPENELKKLGSPKKEVRVRRQQVAGGQS